MTGLLISVRDECEAELALAAGIDVLDLKEPLTGALGALPHTTVRRIVQQVAGRCAVSATVGDLPAEPARMAQAARDMAATGVDYVKLGFFLGTAPSLPDSIRALEEVARDVRLIAVLFADQGIDLAVIEAAAAAGYAGIMLDTAAKKAGSLCDFASVAQLGQFVRAAQAAGLMTGLAGSLRLRDIAALRVLSPDYLGFRGAACVSHDRVAVLDGDSVRALRSAIVPVQALVV